MHLYTRNVNTAFRDLVGLFAGGEIGHHVRNRDRIKIEADIRRSPSRNGSVMVIDEPVTVTYTHPRERVLFNAARDANPFFGLYEQLWMLAGRNDVAPLTYYASKMKDFSDDGVTLNGAYGYRWRHAHVRGKYWKAGDSTEVWENQSTDQLDIIVNHLKADPNSRRAVLQMWNVEDDLLKIGSDCDCVTQKGCSECNWTGKVSSKDVCCNLSVMFSVRVTPERYGDQTETYPEERHLDMTVTNRSNDMVWGMLGQDFITFSILQEYMATRLGVKVGRYHHFTNNLHVYEWNWKPNEWLEAVPELDRGNYGYKPYAEGFYGVPLVREPDVFERELPLFVEHFSGKGQEPVMLGNWKEPFLQDVAEPMLMAFRCHKIHDPKNALKYAGNIKADDWRVACTNWLQRRIK